LRGFSWARASNDSGVVDEGNFLAIYLGGYFFGNVRDKALRLAVLLVIYYPLLACN